MAAEPLTGGLAPSLVLTGGYTLRVTALDPSTGATVTSVIVSDVALQVNAATPVEEAPPLKLEPPVASFGGTGGTEAPGLTRG